MMTVEWMRRRFGLHRQTWEKLVAASGVRPLELGVLTRSDTEKLAAEAYAYLGKRAGGAAGAQR